MAKTNATPVPFWLDMPLVQFGKWVRASNAVVKDENKKIEAARARHRK